MQVWRQKTSRIDRSAKTYLSALALVGTSFLFNAGEAAACSCLATTAEEAYQAASYVFTGRVQDKKTEAGEGSNFSKTDYVLSVDKAYKGSLPSYVVLRSEGDSAQCGISLEIKQSYIVYAYKGGDLYMATSLCSRTGPLAGSEAQADLEWLNRLPSSRW